MNRALTSGPLVWLGILVVTCLLLLVFQTVLWLVLPVLFSVIFCYILTPWVDFAVSKGMLRRRAVFLVTAVLWIIVVVVGLVLEPRIARDIRGIQNGQAQEYLSDASDLVSSARKTLTNKFSLFKSAAAANPTAPNPNAEPLGVVSGSSVPLPATVSAAPGEDLKQNVAIWTDKYSGSVAMELLRWIPSVLLIPYLTYFFLLDGPRFKRFLVQAIPNAFFEKALFLFYRVEDQLRRYFRGVLLLTAVDGFCLGVGLWFLGLKAPFLIAAMAAIMAWLPYLGSIAGGLMAVVVAHHDAPHSPWLPYEVIGLFVVVRLCDDFIFLPLTVGRSLRMHPLVTVLMILMGGAVAGISGLLLVLPVLGVVMVAGQIIGELFNDERVLARHRHARELRRLRARADL
jgi:predicted PurR-regulated permease PerM